MKIRYKPLFFKTIVTVAALRAPEQVANLYGVNFYFFCDDCIFSNLSRHKLNLKILLITCLKTVEPCVSILS